MSRNELAIDVLLPAEADLRLFEPTVAGFALWPVVRYRAWQLLSGVEPRVVRRSLLREITAQPTQVMRLGYAAWSAWQRRHCPRPVDYVLLTLEAHRSVKRTDGWWDVYLDDIANDPAIRDRHLRCEFRHFLLSPWRTVAPRHLFTDGLLLRQVWSGLRGGDAEAENAGRQIAALFAEKLAAADRRLTADKQAGFARYCIQRARMFRVGQAWYRRLFEQVEARVLAIVDAYNQHGAVAAARSLNLPVVEFQHGVIHRDHPGYIWAADVTAARERMPIPTHIATYGEFWSQLLQLGDFWQVDQTPAIGATRMDWLRARTTTAAGRGVTQLIFTTQHPTRAAAIKLLRELLALATSEQFPLELIIKVHRMETPFIHEYQALAGEFDHVRVLSAYEGDTLALIAAADVHASAWSTCHYEAVGLGTPTVVLRFPGPDRTADLAGLPNIRQAATAAEFLAAIRTAAADSPGGQSDAADALFRRGAVANAVALLASLCEVH